MLFALAFVDELASGVPSTSAPAIGHSFGLGHAGTTLVLFAVPGVAALIFEPIVFLLADRYPRAWFIRGGLVAMAAAALVSALAPGPVVLAAAVSVAWIATGASVALAQATLVDRDPNNRARTLARWTLLANAGDLGGPLLLAGLAAVGLGWRAAYVALAGFLAVSALVAFASPLAPAKPEEADDEPAKPLWTSLKEALTDPVLIAWLFGIALCDLLDEILIVFGVFHVRDDLGGSAFWQSATVAAIVAGGAIGLVVLERVLAKRDELRMLLACAIACVAALAVWILAPTPLASMLLAIPLGAVSAPLYPLAAARAYARRPAESGAVLAAGHLFTPLGLALPWLLGLAADRWGVPVALALLGIQPLGLIALATLTRMS